MGQKPILGKEIPFERIDGQVCRVIEYAPLAKLKDKNVVSTSLSSPYASLVVECSKLSGKVTLLLTNKIDFVHLSEAFKKRKKGEEVLIFWTNKNYKNFLYKLLSVFLPKIWVMVCPAGAYDLLSDSAYNPELSGEARWNATKPIAEWKPEVME